MVRGPGPGGQPRAAHACVMQPSQEEANHRAQPLQLVPGVPPDGHLSRWAATPVPTDVTVRPYAVALRPRGQEMPPRGRSLGHALLGSPTRGLMGCPGGRQGRAHLAHRLPEERQRPCRRYGPATTTATANPWGRAAAGCAKAMRRQGAAGTATFREWRATETVLLRRRGVAQPYGPPGRRWCGLPVRPPHDSANMGQFGRSGSSRQSCMGTKVPSRDWQELQ